MTAGGHRLAYRWIRPMEADAPIAVFLHEGLGSLELWRDVPDALVTQTGCGALLYSRYGNGFSDVLSEARTPHYMHDEALTVLPEVLERCAIDPQRVVLIGHS